MPERPRELLGSSYIKDSHGIATVEPLLQFVYLDPCDPSSHFPNQTRQHGNRRKQPKRKDIANCRISVAAQHTASCVTEPRVGNGTGDHADERRNPVLPERNACKP